MLEPARLPAPELPAAPYEVGPHKQWLSMLLIFSVLIVWVRLGGKTQSIEEETCHAERGATDNHLGRDFPMFSILVFPWVSRTQLMLWIHIIIVIVCCEHDFNSFNFPKGLAGAAKVVNGHGKMSRHRLDRPTPAFQFGMLRLVCRCLKDVRSMRAFTEGTRTRLSHLIVGSIC
eukprot:3261908-Amphidinium_carterae.2